MKVTMITTTNEQGFAADAANRIVGRFTCVVSQHPKHPQTMLVPCKELTKADVEGALGVSDLDVRVVNHDDPSLPWRP